MESDKNRQTDSAKDCKSRLLMPWK